MAALSRAIDGALATGSRTCSRIRRSAPLAARACVCIGSPLLWAGLATDSVGARHAAREVRLVMGTTAEVMVSGAHAPESALNAAFSALAHVDDSMSLWKESELTRLNDSGGGHVSRDLLIVLSHALDVARASQGAFDPTVEPLVRAAGGFGGSAHGVSDSERRALLARVGFSRVQVDAASGAVSLAPGTRLDLGAIAKGYAADLALRALRAAGATAGLVDLGQSSMVVFGEDLEVVVRDPEHATAPAWARFRAHDSAVSTSGGDQRPRHILDPRTGLPAHEVLAATVVARTGIEADALSTALYVLGADGLRLIERRGAAGFVLQRTAGRPSIRATAGFAASYKLSLASGVRLGSAGP